MTSPCISCTGCPPTRTFEMLVPLLLDLTKSLLGRSTSTQFDAGAQIAATVHPASSADQLLPSARKRTSNVYCFVRTPCTAVPGAVFMALISFPWPMMTMFQVPSE